MNEPWPGSDWLGCFTGCRDLERERLFPFEERMSIAILGVDNRPVAHTRMGTARQCRAVGSYRSRVRAAFISKTARTRRPSPCTSNAGPARDFALTIGARPAAPAQAQHRGASVYRSIRQWKLIRRSERENRTSRPAAT